MPKPPKHKSVAKTTTSSQKSPAAGRKALLTDGGEYVVMDRRKLKDAPYNPRSIDPIAERGLAESIKESGGLLDPPVWNKRTGHIVGGHQRLARLDAINGTDDYTLTVCVVDLDDAEEVATNIRLNNPHIQGTYDLERLSELLSRQDVDLESTGFDVTALETLYLSADHDLPDWLAGDSPETLDAVTDALTETADLIEQVETEAVIDKDAAEESARIADYKAKKVRFANEQQFKHQFSTHIKVVWPSEGTLQRFLQRLGVDTAATYVDGLQMLTGLGIDVESLLGDDIPSRRKVATVD